MVIMEMDKYRDFGIKLTPQRLAIFKFLNGNRSHPSADDIFNAVKKDFPTMSFATVYNTMDALKSKGAIRELTIESGKKRYDPDCSQHHHLICVECKIVVDIFKEFNDEQRKDASPDSEAKKQKSDSKNKNSRAKAEGKGKKGSS